MCMHTHTYTHTHTHTHTHTLHMWDGGNVCKELAQVKNIYVTYGKETEVLVNIPTCIFYHGDEKGNVKVNTEK